MQRLQLKIKSIWYVGEVEDKDEVIDLLRESLIDCVHVIMFSCYNKVTLKRGKGPASP